ncbi:class I SAM-dependent methyltransferase [Rhizocola hellebori]|uniref:class I SAM-dependent methyltransferase n=1 Tax=Rhizocola hellebori TaxID=1392758 RepID=UPI001940C1B8|nr:class I SAM-dependent methyltransferase [Rhizocola hellebori]
MRQIPTGVYGSAQAAGYAFDRPPVHQHQVARFAVRGRVLDVGCGAGLSAAALHGHAEVVVGLEPNAGMLAYRRQVAPHAHFVVGRAEQLPFADAAFDMITAAGSLNYVDLDLFFAEARRVLRPGGVVVVYDFWPGPWYEIFERRYPSAPGYALDIEALRPRRYERFDVTVSMDHEASLRFMLTECAGADPGWLSEQLATLGPDFVFHSYLAEIVP